MSRIRGHVVRATVRLSNTNGQRGRGNKHCQFQLRLRGLPEVVISDTEADLYGPAERTAQTLGRNLERARHMG